MKLERLADASLDMEFGLVPWDTRACGFPVAQIRSLRLTDAGAAVQRFHEFEAWRDAQRAMLVSCRLPHDALRESMFLETFGFRFIEMVFQPELEIDGVCPDPDPALKVAAPTPDELPGIEEIAAQAFTTDRFHLDHRLPAAAGGERYRRWVRSAAQSADQRLVSVKEGENTVSFFVVQTAEDGSCYWHLNAIAPAFQGKGYGKRVWRTMLAGHHAEGVRSVRSMISVRNTPVVNLYARLGFRFRPPQSTFHWAREQLW